jgi:hypothetical protein
MVCALACTLIISGTTACSSDSSGSHPDSVGGGAVLTALQRPLAGGDLRRSPTSRQTSNIGGGMLGWRTTRAMTSQARAAGAVGTSADDEREVLCVNTSDDTSAADVAAAWPRRLQTTTAGGNRPWSPLLSDPHAEVLGGPAHTVRLTAHTKEIGILLEEQADGGVDGLIGR